MQTAPAPELTSPGAAWPATVTCTSAVAPSSSYVYLRCNRPEPESLSEYS